MNKRNKIAWIMMSGFSILMVFLGVVFIATSVYSRHQEMLQKEVLVDDFLASIEELSDEELRENQEYEEANLDDSGVIEIPNYQQPNPVRRNTIAVMRIPVINLSAPVGFGVGEADLRKQIGMYTTTDKFLTLGGNTGFAAHTSFRGRCSYCFFYRLHETEIGQEVFIDYQDGNTYRFEIIEIKRNMPIDADIPYLFKIDDLKLITLTTCSTYGRTRDFVVAKHIETFPIRR